MVTDKVIRRVFRIRVDQSTGSAFTLEYEGRQYLITARHVAEGVPDARHISRAREDRWEDIDLKVVGFGDGEVDVAVLAGSEKLSPTLSMEPSTEGLALGQYAYFLGFPFGWDSGAEHINDGYPVPFVKGGVLSAMRLDGPVHRFYVDSHVNHGFSGGPLVYRPKDQLQEDFRVAGVVRGIPRLKPEDENPGLVLAVGISHVLALIRKNPIGFEVPYGQ